MIRNNTGLPAAVNGARLVSLLDEIHAGWPVRIRSIALVGHSMGGLVIRSAYAKADLSEHRWIVDATT